MKVLSLFDGISCGQVALNRIGLKPNLYMASEIDKPAIQCTQFNFPQTVQLGEVVRVREMAEAGLFADVDLLIGGSPCQGFSSAGDGLGFDDPRSKLFFEFIRIKNAIRPKWFLLENVKMKKQWLDVISLHMGVTPVFINSADFSAQNRQRFYWTNIPVAPWVPHGPSLSDVVDYGWFSDREKSYAIDANYLKRHICRGSRQIVFMKQLAHGTNKGFEKPVEKSPSITISSWHYNNKISLDCKNWRVLTVAECERLQTLPPDYTLIMKRSHAYKAIGNGWTVDVISHIFKGLLT